MGCSCSHPPGKEVPVFIDNLCSSIGLDSEQKIPVDLAVSHFPGSSQWALAGQLMQAYHTSIVFDGCEYVFNREAGLGCRPLDRERFSTPPSHDDKTNTKVFQVGHTCIRGEALLRKLRPHFQPGSYDIVAKNCNAFTDCAPAFLVSKRLPSQYSAMEKLGQDAHSTMPSLLTWMTSGRYKVNEKARDFNLEAVILQVDLNAWMGTAAQNDRLAEAECDVLQHE
eukprot:TRINITY_DN5588_c0_g1_i1.p1 TRINITY_DN5588_c0_g1~~TRINITY_DN5588_c0_g1_i1.p1  ORF type:complete len:224 (-),score=31.62 TRINITY_DN5588_c0_g1_i1:66-737(-)